MANRSTTAHVKDKDRHLTVSQHESDAPILPMVQLEKLRDIAPERIGWVFNEAEKEGNWRRSETVRINTFTFVERIFGMIAGLGIGALSLYVTYLLAMAGHDAVAGIVGGTTVVGLVSSFVIGVKRRGATK